MTKMAKMPKIPYNLSVWKYFEILGPTTTTTPKPVTEDDEADPNGHSHKTNNFKMESMMKPFMSFSKMFSRRNSARSAPRREERRVKIDFSQNGEELPEGSIETISAGGGRSPGHHEGGGLTVKVKEEPSLRRIKLTKPVARKTLNFFFTW